MSPISCIRNRSAFALLLPLLCFFSPLTLRALPAQIPSQSFPGLEPAVAAYNSGDFSRTLELIAELPPPKHPRPEPALLRALASAQVLPPEEALRACNDAIALRASSSDLLALRGELLLKLGKTTEALDSIQSAIWFNRFSLLTPADALFTRANALQTGEQETRHESLRAVLQANPKHHDARIALAEQALANGNRAEVLTLLNALPEKTTKEELIVARALLIPGNPLTQKRDFGSAESILRQLREKELSPTDSQEVQHLLIETLLRKGALADAEKEITAALKASPKDFQLLRLQEQLRVSKSAVAKSVF